ncbi:DnaJ-like protein DjlA [Rhodobacteraceae bacterium THAF1]|uniref:J domain-containing protein n=1 Tax=Palleronia sp. THAF1 TaxID=2587842 RepID=UPI000F40D519|nr:DnaJ family molecular chaperone [Palleronia sp. THAF1]QFU09343.1 DnaJ-like protein DjlA [Palleronia sp. THAF1]VDC26799.1 DnaJ-like protein DjlA [Rhodobacteraceae bacterium THAF1]
MSIWTRILDALAALRQGDSLAEIFERLRTPPEQSVGFTIAVIALGAKMAKADGTVTRDEVTAFREVFTIPPEAEAAAGRVFNLARQDVAGFEDYATRIAKSFGRGSDMLEDLLDGLFHIAAADGDYHPDEEVFLRRVQEIFGISEAAFRQARARHVPDAAPDPYAILGVDPDAPLADIQRAYRKLVKESHPDRMIARGVPTEAVRLAERRLSAINDAWAEIEAARA